MLTSDTSPSLERESWNTSSISLSKTQGLDSTDQLTRNVRTARHSSPTKCLRLCRIIIPLLSMVVLALLEVLEPEEDGAMEPCTRPKTKRNDLNDCSPGSLTHLNT
ncbi:hypothetical protein M378DRAFT_399536 [Amanita muscaria Koide BX008]|uniref:Uncharacterized protein n=1 Tax=Amanita muscaria (strain Koide BX008) TaxID=946122 RepID=A0A0C2WKJ2_AMAMK|nr:hypothetical protein M378DRAFT_399536 [Amanita muscaria Koide BX008]